MNSNIFKFHFEKRAKIPWYFGLGQALGHVVDGLTGLVMLPFGRYGTSFSNYACERALIYGIKLYRKNREAAR